LVLLVSAHYAGVVVRVKLPCSNPRWMSSRTCALAASGIIRGNQRQSPRSGTVDHEVSVVLKSGERFNFPIGADEMAAFDARAARHWIGEEFAKAGLENPNPMGKMLLVDQILLLTENFKPSDFHPATPELRRFLGAALNAMGRPTLTIDLQAYKL
jgi:hypothetical protein